MSKFILLNQVIHFGEFQKHHISVKELARINSLSGRMIHNLRIGQKIYLQNDVNNTNNFETQLKIILMDLSFKPILKATIQLEFDGKKLLEIQK